MKNWKHCAIIGILAIIVFGVVFTACDDGKLCVCNDKVHDETCPCGGKDCDCMEQFATLEGTSIKIYKQAGITVAQMNTTVSNINSAYGRLSGDDATDGEKKKFVGHVTTIHITLNPSTDGSSVAINGTTLSVGYKESDDYILTYIYILGLVS